MRIAGAPAPKAPAPKPAPPPRRYLPPSIHTGNNPGGTAVRPAPRPAPAPKLAPPPSRKSYLPTNPRGGNNPAGVAITHEHRPTRTAKILGTGANPSGVAIVKPHFGGLSLAGEKHLLAKEKAAKDSGGGGLLGVIENPLGSIVAPALHTITQIPSDIAHIASSPIVSNAWHDIRGLPVATVEGIGTIAKAAGEDIYYDATHNALLGGPVAPNLSHLTSEAWHSSIIKPLLEGHVGEALHQFKAHPIYGILDFAGDVGAVGRIAGIAARTGALGERVAEAAATAREDRPLGEGIQGIKRHYSPNPLKKAAQVAGEHVPLPNAIDRRIVEHHLSKRVDDIIGVNASVARKHLDQLVHDQADALKGGKRITRSNRKTAANVASLVVQGVASGKELFDELHSLRETMHEHLNDGDRVTRAAAAQHVKNIDAFLAKPDVQAVNDIVGRYVGRQRTLDAEQADLGLLDAQRARGAAAVPYAVTHMPGVHFADTPQLSVRAVAYTEARRSVKQAERALGDVQDSSGRLTAVGNAEAVLRTRKAEKTLAKAVAAERKSYGVLLGRHGASAELSAADADRMNRYLSKTSDAQLRLKAVRQALAGESVDRRAVAAENLAAAKADLKEARSFARDLHDHQGERIKGLVTDVKVGRRTGVRRVTAAEIQRHMVAHGKEPAEIAHVALDLPHEDGMVHDARTTLSRGDSRLKSRTGKGIEAGAFKPGHQALADSQIKALRRIDRARAHDAFVREVAVHGPDGLPLSFTKEEAPDAAASYHEHTGTRVAAVPLFSASHNADAAVRLRELTKFTSEDGSRILTPTSPETTAAHRFTLVPQDQVDRYIEHMKRDEKAPGLASRVTRQFRNTVLPFSPKWLTGNVVEGLLRSALVGAGPRDARLAAKVLERMRTEGHVEQADRLEALMGGLHYGLGYKANERAIGAGAMAKAERVDDPRVLEMARTVSGAYTRMIQPIFHFNQRLEQAFEHAALGVHMSRQMREFGASWAAAAMHEDEWIKRLAEGYADPKLAADAGRFIHKTLGQYDRFGPQMRKVLNNAAPFAPWYISAVRFVYLTMPADHPLVQSVLLAASQAAAHDYAEQGRQLEAAHVAGTFGGTPVGDLLSAVPVGSGANKGYLNVGRYTPWGAFTQGPSGFTGIAFPQAQGPALAAIAGEDPFGRPLKDAHGYVTDGGQQWLIGLNELLASIAGPVDTLHRIGNDGRTEWSGSTLWHTETKPGTNHGAAGLLGGIERTLSPAYPTYLNRESASVAGGGTPGFVATKGSSGFVAKSANSGFVAKSANSGFVATKGSTGYVP